MVDSFKRSSECCGDRIEINISSVAQCAVAWITAHCTRLLATGSGCEKRQPSEKSITQHTSHVSHVLGPQDSLLFRNDEKCEREGEARRSTLNGLRRGKTVDSWFCAGAIWRHVQVQD
eukprot:scpid89141/ scgid25450/ 